jgi:uncharacterized protein
MEKVESRKEKSKLIMSSRAKNAIIIFAKYPRKGKVKTRLAKTIGDDIAMEIYKLCAEHTFTECQKLSKTGTLTYLFYSHKRDKAEIKNWTKSKFVLIPQEGQDLGERIYNAFDKVFKDGHSKVIIIGTDLPDISSEIIYSTLKYLDNFHAVIGPADDGGYYLLGLKSLKEEFFEGIEWSTDSVFKETINKLKTNKVKTKTLPVLSDIDTVEDLKKWGIKNQGMKQHPLTKLIEKIILS